MIDLTQLPQHHCQSTHCTHEGPYWDGAIAQFGDVQELVIGWCPHCQRYVCNECAVQVLPIGEEIAPLFIAPVYMAKMLELLASQKPGDHNLLRKLVCRRCGTPLGKTQEWLFLEGERYLRSPLNVIKPIQIMEHIERAKTAMQKGDGRKALQHFKQAARLLKREDWNKNPHLKELHNSIAGAITSLNMAGFRSG